MDRHGPQNLKVRNKQVNKVAWSSLSRLLMHTLVVGFSLSKTQTGRRDHCRLVQNTKYRDCRKSNEWVGDPGTDLSKRGSGPMNQMGELPPVPYILIMSLGERTHVQDREKILQAISIH